MRRLPPLLCAVTLVGAGYGEALRDVRHDAGARQMAGAVYDHGKLVWTGAAGAGAKASDVYSLASLSKTYTAAMTLRLGARGRLALGDRVGRWLSGRIPAAAARVTVRELLNHTSGLPDYLEDPRIDRALGDPYHRWTEAELLRAVRAPRDRGTFAYSNTNYVLLGAIVRRVSGLRADQLLAREIIEPLGLRSTSMVRVERLARRVAGHQRLPNDVWNPLWTDGGVVSSAADVARFLDGLLVSGRVLPPAWLDDMLTPVAASYGLGIYSVELLGVTVYGHDGSYGGWESYGLGGPSTGVTVVVLAHGGEPGGPDRGIRALAAAAREAGVL